MATQLGPIENYYNLIFWCVNRYAKHINQSALDDLIQDCMLLLIKCYRKYNHASNIKPTTYFTKSIILYIRSWKGRKANRIIKNIDNDSIFIETKFVSKIIDQLTLADLLLCLSQENRDIVFRHVGLGETLGEISRDYGITPEAIRNRIKRSMSKIQCENQIEVDHGW